MTLAGQMSKLVVVWPACIGECSDVISVLCATAT